MREELIRRSARLDALSKHPDYPELQAEAERKIGRIGRTLVADLVTAGKPADQRQIDYSRGWIDALHWVVNLPDKAEDTLARALREAEKRKGGNT